MKLGFVSAILPELSLEEIFETASRIGYDCVEVMCWPVGKSTRRYAGITHINVSEFNQTDADKINNLCDKYGVDISALGYYPNPLVADEKEANVYKEHITKMIDAASILGLNVVNSFVGRDHRKSVEDNWSRFEVVWKDIIRHAESRSIQVGIENCPMLFTNDEWPGGKNLATSPSIWSEMFDRINSDNFGLNYDPSHMIWQHMDYLSPMQNFESKLFHVHAKDVRIDQQELNLHGIMAPPNLWHTPKLPGLGEVDWGKFFSILSSVGYDGAVCVEVEDRAYEGSFEKRKLALVQSHSYLRQFIPRLGGF